MEIMIQQIIQNPEIKIYLPKEYPPNVCGGGAYTNQGPTLLWYLNGTPIIKQPRGLLIQGWY